jgi:hypothetical protein
MSLETTLAFTCDKADCRQVVSWIKERAERDESAMPEVAKYLVIFNLNGAVKTFCCQLHAAEFFLPPGYAAMQNKTIEIPKPEDREETTLPWLVRSTDERNVISRSEADPIPQADGDNSPDNGQEPA